MNSPSSLSAGIPRVPDETLVGFIKSASDRAEAEHGAGNYSHRSDHYESMAAAAKKLSNVCKVSAKAVDKAEREASGINERKAAEKAQKAAEQADEKLITQERQLSDTKRKAEYAREDAERHLNKMKAKGNEFNLYYYF